MLLVTKRTKLRKKKIIDPNFERESLKYKNPIPSRECIAELINLQGCPMALKEIANFLAIKEDQVEALSRRLNAMARDAQLIRNRRGGYCVVDKQNLIPGRVIGHQDGYGFLRPDEGGNDLFLGPREMKKVWHGDHVIAQISGKDRRGRLEGVIVEVVERAYTKLVGKLNVKHGVITLIPDNKRISHQVLIDPDCLLNAVDGQFVVTEIIEHPTVYRQPFGMIIEIIGDQLTPGMETDVAIRAHNLPNNWTKSVLSEANKLDKKVSEKLKEGRFDLSELPFITIDGDDAKDFDDAVYCEKSTKGWKLFVAIADVAEYVKPNTALDEAAYERGTSVYFPDRVIPMLPENISNGLCSLKPNQDRLVVVAEMYFDKKGKMYRSTFFEGFINSHARITYSEAEILIFEENKKIEKKFSLIIPQLKDLFNFYKMMQKNREKRGAIDFETTETKFRFDKKGKVANIVPEVRGFSHKIIEECMLSANVAAARFLIRHKIPSLFRIHEKPSIEKLTDLSQFLSEMGVSLKGGLKPSAKDYVDLLKSVKNRTDAHIIQTVLLRSMMQAVYSHDNSGHFGLAFDAYAHFTSPIRRYPDLMVHRAIKHVINGGSSKNFQYDIPHLAAMGEHCSALERRADDASRDSIDALKCEFMLDKVGQVFDGVISGVHGFGLFIELSNIYISGLIHITALDKDYFHFDPIGHRLIGERTHKTYRLGDPIQVCLAAVSLEEKKLDLILPNKKSKSKSKSKIKRKKNTKKSKRKKEK